MSLYSAMLNVKRVSSLLSHLDALGGSEAEHPEDEGASSPSPTGRSARSGSGAPAAESSGSLMASLYLLFFWNATLVDHPQPEPAPVVLFEDQGGVASRAVVANGVVDEVAHRLLEEREVGERRDRLRRGRALDLHFQLTIPLRSLPPSCSFADVQYNAPAQPLPQGIYA